MSWDIKYVRYMEINGKEYREIIGFDKYLISDNGDVYSKNRKRSKITQNVSGRAKVSLFNGDGRKWFFVDYLVALHWIENKNDFKYIHHIDGNKLNNNISNLKWVEYDELFHGYSKTKIYSVWEAIKQRCLNPNDRGYKNYGGRGIRICDEWLNSMPFILWAINNGYRDGLQIDRINNNGDYEPSNCRWVDATVNNSNQRKNLLNSSGYTGVYFYKNKKDAKKYWSFITCRGKRISLNYHETKEAAVYARNKYITDNNLPHPIQKIRKIYGK
jgi:hypothetical protein